MIGPTTDVPESIATQSPTPAAGRMEDAQPGLRASQGRRWDLITWSCPGQRRLGKACDERPVDLLQACPQRFVAAFADRCPFCFDPWKDAAASRPLDGVPSAWQACRPVARSGMIKDRAGGTPVPWSLGHKASANACKNKVLERATKGPTGLVQNTGTEGSTWHVGEQLLAWTVAWRSFAFLLILRFAR
jgi:hypothetical protein